MSQQPSLDEETPAGIPATRRVVLAGAGAAAIALLAGCATYDSSTGSGSSGGQGASAPVSIDPVDPNAGGTDDAGGGDAVAQTTDIPVGGGTVLDRQKVVITQPKAGSFKAFTAVCTHQGCIVADVSNGTINCPCHGSKFHVADGSVANGPAARPLRAVGIKVSGTDIQLA